MALASQAFVALCQLGSAPTGPDLAGSGSVGALPRWPNGNNGQAGSGPLLPSGQRASAPLAQVGQGHAWPDHSGAGPARPVSERSGWVNAGAMRPSAARAQNDLAERDNGPAGPARWLRPWPSWAAAAAMLGQIILALAYLGPCGAGPLPHSTSQRYKGPE